MPPHPDSLCVLNKQQQKVVKLASFWIWLAEKLDYNLGKQRAKLSHSFLHWGANRPGCTWNTIHHCTLLPSCFWSPGSQIPPLPPSLLPYLLGLSLLGSRQWADKKNRSDKRGEIHRKRKKQIIIGKKFFSLFPSEILFAKLCGLIFMCLGHKSDPMLIHVANAWRAFGNQYNSVSQPGSCNPWGCHRSDILHMRCLHYNS